MRRRTLRERWTLRSLRTMAALPVFVALSAAAGCGPPASGLSGAELYAEHCQRCHGDDGSGDPRLADLASAVNLHRSRLVARRDRGAIYLRIVQGGGSMPGFSHKLERGDVEVLIDFVLDLKER